MRLPICMLVSGQNEWWLSVVHGAPFLCCCVYSAWWGGDLDFKKKSDLRRLGRDIYNFVVALIAVMEREGLGWGFVFVFLFLFLCFSFSWGLRGGGKVSVHYIRSGTKDQFWLVRLFGVGHGPRANFARVTLGPFGGSWIVRLTNYLSFYISYPQGSKWMIRSIGQLYRWKEN